MNAAPALQPFSSGVNLHDVTDRAVHALRRAYPERRVHHVMRGDGAGLCDERGLLIAIGILLSVASDESQADVFVHTRGTARYGVSIEVRVDDADGARSPVALLDLHLARQIFERNGGTLDAFEDDGTRTLLASLPRVVR